MSAYIVVEIDIHDPDTYERYKALAPASIAQYGGRYLVRGGTTRPLEGDWHPPRFVILEFPDATQAHAWWESEEYAPAKALRHLSARTQMLLVEGLDAPPEA
ncbi:MAG TPA: DUF1330 domain-containing protein [Rubricoccaceae bacterium]|nr:DUF1330 domain-containing protein [Rubricoccaceae bacterium]